MNPLRDDGDEPRWLRLAARVRAEADPGTLARVRARLAARDAGPAWVRWLARPVALAASAGLIVVSAVAGSWLLQGEASNAGGESVALSMGDLLGEDGSYGLALDRPASSDAVSPSDSQGVSR